MTRTASRQTKSLVSARRAWSLRLLGLGPHGIIVVMPKTGGRDSSAARDGLHDPDVALFARMRWNAPLSAEHADLLLDRMTLGPGQAIADLGCGWGELLMNAAARAGPGAAGIGVDLDEPPEVAPGAPEVLPGARDEASPTSSSRADRLAVYQRAFTAV